MKYRYNKISIKFWTDEKVLQWDSDTRLLALYLLTCPHKNTEGFYRLPKQYICADLNWDQKRLIKPFAKLLDEGFIKYDKRVNILFITEALKYQAPENPNQEKSAINKLKELPETDLIYDFIDKAKEYCKGLYERLVEQFGKPQSLSQPLTQTLSSKNKNSKSSEPKKQKNSKKLKTKRKNKLTKDTPSFQTACFFIDKILENNPRSRVPEKDPEHSLMQKWCKELERLHRLGPVGAKKSENKGYDWQEIWQIIDWSQKDNFWKTNILCPKSLRKQVVKLENKMKSAGNKKNKDMKILKQLYDDMKIADKKGGCKVL
ncbi:MAG: hypothetical protein ACOCQ2_03225 [Halanaerobiales bacterium]